MAVMESDEWIEVHSVSVQKDDEGLIIFLRASATDAFTAYCDALRYTVHKYYPEAIA